MAVLAATAISAVPAGAAQHRFAIESSNPAFPQGSQTSFHIPRVAHKTDDGGTNPGDTPPVVTSVGADLLVGPPVTSAMLIAQFASKSPLQTERLLGGIPIATTAATSLAALRANILRIASAYMAAPTLEDKNSSNRSKLICALGTARSCSERWAWCAIFASSMWRMAGVRAMHLTPPVGGLVAWAKAHHRWRDTGTTAYKNFTPDVGDIVAYGCNRKRDFCDHTGLVVRSDAKNLRTIEGNTSTPIPGRDGVASKLRPRHLWISGYISLA
jgi:hypothetical protein